VTAKLAEIQDPSRSSTTRSTSAEAGALPATPTAMGALLSGCALSNPFRTRHPTAGRELPATPRTRGELFANGQIAGRRIRDGQVDGPKDTFDAFLHLGWHVKIGSQTGFLR
jgi:hypothetical protein